MSALLVKTPDEILLFLRLFPIWHLQSPSVAISQHRYLSMFFSWSEGKTKIKSTKH